MPRVMEPTHKFLPSEWKHANQVHFGIAEAERARSERLTAECQRLVEESEKSVRRMQQDANMKLEQRITDIQFWRQELDQKLQEIVQEIEVLVIFKNRVEKALEGTSEPLKATLQCLDERQKRVAIDLVIDNVEKELLKEKEVIEGVMTLLQRTLEQIIEQIRLIRSAKYYLEKDLRDKFQANRIDDICSMLTVTSANAEEQIGTAQFTAGGSTVTPEEWENFSDMNIRKAEKEKNNSLSLRALVESLLEQTAADMQRQHRATGTALELRVHETRTAKDQLEDQLNKLLVEIASQEQNMEALKVAIADKESPLKVAQTRLYARSQRPSIELCHDPVHTRLLSEVQELADHITRLKEALAQSEMELKALIRSQLILEEEIQIKAHSLYIDDVICTQLHQPITIHHF
ncbi:tektin-1 [Astyanax mexicanus]|uniref:Tektin n=1 Tax=Astyanax mexicanus TaxID=7994 RepID=A0A8B9J761_ASTMX|nr:tektin-1 [Astyanax mexicanus]